MNAAPINNTLFFSHNSGKLILISQLKSLDIDKTIILLCPLISDAQKPKYLQKKTCFKYLATIRLPFFKFLS